MTTTVITQRGDYHHGLCSCCEDMGICCDIMWCYWCNYGRLWSGAEGKPNHMDTNKCLMIAFLGVGVPVFGMLLRTFLISYTPVCCGCDSWMVASLIGRTKNNWGIVRQNCIYECFLEAYCCGFCNMVRISREMRSQGVDPGYVCCKPSTPTVSFANVVQPGYQPPMHPGFQQGYPQGNQAYPVCGPPQPDSQYAGYQQGYPLATYPVEQPVAQPQRPQGRPPVEFPQPSAPSASTHPMKQAPTHTQVKV